MNENKYPGISPQEININSESFVHHEIIRVKDLLSRGVRSISVNIGLARKVQKIFEEAGWMVKLFVSGVLEFSCKEDDLEQ